MDNFQIETAQNITIHQNVANITTRIGSFLIDVLIIVAYYIVVILFSSLLNLITYKFSFVTIILIFPVLFYSLIFETFMNGQTPGKYFNKLRVVRLDGRKPTFGSYLIRWLLRIIDITLFSGSVAVVTILLNGKGQRLGDIAASTTVISERKRVQLSDTLINSIPDNHIPTFPQVTLLNDKDVQTIRHLYKDALRKRKHEVLLKLSDKVKELTEIKTEMKPVDFLDVVIKDYYYYTQQ